MRELVSLSFCMCVWHSKLLFRGDLEFCLHRNLDTIHDNVPMNRKQLDWSSNLNAIDRDTCRQSDKSKTLCHVPNSEGAQRVYSFKPQVSWCILTTSLNIYI